MPEISVVVPAYRERENVAPLLAALERALAGLDWETIIVVDDGSDRTEDIVRERAQHDPRVRCIHRIGRRGLASASIEGMLASSAPYLAGMDADMQHDERLLPEMLAALESGDLDVVVGSRYMERGSLGSASANRQRISRFGTYLAGLVLSADLKDPLSGFFVIRREMLQEVVRRLSGIGFKILLDILASASRPPRLRELPYTFRPRHAGQTKLDSVVAWEYLMMLLD